MKRTIIAALALVFAIGLMPQAARAQDNPNWNAFGLAHPRPGSTLVLGGVGGRRRHRRRRLLPDQEARHSSRIVRCRSAQPMAVTTYACAVVYPFVGTVLLNRPLTPREMYDGVGDCIVPFIGG